MRRHLLRFHPWLRFVTSAVLAASAGSSIACSHQAATPAAAEPTAPAGPSTRAFVPAKLGASVFILHTVSDVDGFETFFERGQTQRDAGGVNGYLLSKLSDGRLIVHLFADDVNTVQAALNSEEMRGYLGREGAPDASFVLVTNDISVSLSQTPPSGQTFSLYYKLEVPDFEEFKRGFEARDPLYAAHGVIGRGLHQTSAQRTVVVHFVGTARDRLEALTKTPELVQLMALAAPDGAGRPLFAVDLARSRPN